MGADLAFLSAYGARALLTYLTALQGYHFLELTSDVDPFPETAFRNGH
ncbi:MAG: hypothetical protein JSV94_02525 [Methanobacteriota archaeon]|nr:MAG: hypothetical protein JSV94_02525 [Euryarchaeota archaeon]